MAPRARDRGRRLGRGRLIIFGVAAVIAVPAARGSAVAQADTSSRELRDSLADKLESAFLTLGMARDTPLELARSFYNVGRAYADLSRPDSARSYYDSALVVIDRAGYGFLRASVLHAAGRLHHRVADPPDLELAVRYYTRAAAQRAVLRSAAGADRLRVGAAEQAADLFGDWAAALAGLSRDPGSLAALAASERGRAQALLDLLGDAETSPSRGPAGELEAATEDASATRRRLQREAESLLSRIGDLPLLYYQLAADTLFVWAGSAESGLRLIRRPVTGERTSEYVEREGLPRYYLRQLLPAAARDSIAGLVGSLRAGLGTAAIARAGEGFERSETVGGGHDDSTAAAAAAAGLASLLIPPEALDALPEDGELLIVPYGPLALVPFALLPLPGSRVGDSGRPGRDDPAGADSAHVVELLGDRFALRYAPSLATLAAVEERAPPPLGATASPGGAGADSSSWRRPVPDALVIGNPEMPEIRQGVREIRLRDLPEAEEEADEVARRLGAELLTGARASEPEVWSRLAGASIVHLATHGIAYSAERRARRSFVALAPARADLPGARGDGRLEVGEVLEEGPLLRAELVVLSACQTGLGSITESEGTIGFQRAFLARGARSVLVSLWKVSDEATRALMGRFYFHWLARGLRKADALRAAQRDVRRVEVWAEPRYWAAFQLVGAG